ncbi:Sigma-F factor [Anaerohalosphaera lusitana]|uniref:RNA polymerase sigma factor n=1 Tax=Anaerohalosphaera lusitana TaxID=1936003 RepID=A0A1U9NN85_9BACT|nr:FliA/WhiG family RNA polymerase sigma factor [Anaerohalosphaera lusitana]AQT68986.1 Sigma-F factor [Anaerohalosphaera lusitana]
MVAVKSIKESKSDKQNKCGFFEKEGGQLGLDERNELLKKFLPLVRSIAAKVSSSTSSNVEFDDMVSVGVFGLMRAIDNYDPSREVHFSTYARSRIKGAMLDELRQSDWIPRHTRRQVNKYKRAKSKLVVDLGREPKQPEIAAELGKTMEEFRKWQYHLETTSLVSLDSLSGGSDDEDEKLGWLADPGGYDPSMPVQQEDSRNYLTKSLGKIERLIIKLYYYEQLTMREVGSILKISESRVSQMHSDILERLRERLGSNEEFYHLAS